MARGWRKRDGLQISTRQRLETPARLVHIRRAGQIATALEVMQSDTYLEVGQCLMSPKGIALALEASLEIEWRLYD